MGGPPDGIDSRRDVDLERRGKEVWVRRAVLALMLAVIGCALADVFGQGPVTTTASSPAAELRVRGAERLRGGLLGQITVQATPAIRVARPQLVLAHGMVDDVTINTVTPEPDAEAIDPYGRLVLAFGPVAAHATLTVRVEYQVNPTNVGSGDQDVWFRDGASTLAHVGRDVVYFP